MLKNMRLDSLSPTYKKNKSNEDYPIHFEKYLINIETELRVKSCNILVIVFTK